MYTTALKVLKKIEDRGYQAYIVGGYVRDRYMNRDSIDIDICTNATPKEIKTIFSNIMIPNIKYGSVTVIYNKIRFEITTFRKEIEYKNNRLPVKIEYIDNLCEDIKRRDFTINTLCMDSKGNIIDLLEGIADINNKVVKMVGNPKDKLKEDALRILRAIRFATILNFELDSNLQKYIKKYGNLLKKLSYQRKKEELDKIFTSNNVKYGVELIKKLKLDKPLQLSNLDSLVITSSIMGIWAQLDVVDIYRFNNNEKNIIRQINELKNKDILKDENIYKYGLYITTLVGEIKKIDRRVITKKYNELYIKAKRDIVLTPQDICKLLERQPGPFLKTIIDDLEEQLLHKEIENKKELLSNYILTKYNKYE